MTPFPQHQIDSLKENLLVESVYVGTVISDVELECLFNLTPDGDNYPLIIQSGNQLLVTKMRDGGTYYMHFLSMIPNRFHYRSPWISDDQVTLDEELR